MAEACAVHFSERGLPPDGGYDQRWVLFSVGPLRCALPNGRRRRAAVGIHDLHHIVTGYGTDLSGEAENAAWELGSGCRPFSGAWWLDLVALAPGVLFWPRRAHAAFVRGRRSTNLYARAYGELLEQPVEDLRRQTLALRSHPAYVADLVSFAWHALWSLPVGAVALVASVALRFVADRHS